MTEQEEKKTAQFAQQLIMAINEVFDEDSEHSIDQDDIMENTTLFVHALLNVAPTFLTNKITGANRNYLETNHLANQLIHQFSTTD